MSFAFNFATDDAVVCETEIYDDAFMESALSDQNLTPCKEIFCEEAVSTMMNNVPQMEFCTGLTTMKKTLLHHHSGMDKDLDLISGTYEGGYKVWECSLDLVNYMYENQSGLPGTNSSVLELGCGHGYPGIAALKLGFSSVLFSDLNAEVLVESTWPNIVVNCPGMVDRCRCFAGDWLSLSQHLECNYSTNGAKEAPKFDFILSAETLYSVESCRKVYFLTLVGPLTHKRHSDVSHAGCAFILIRSRSHRHQALLLRGRRRHAGTAATDECSSLQAKLRGGEGVQRRSFQYQRNTEREADS